MLKHGKSNSPEWYSYHNMMTRCYNPNFKQWDDYGGRGIKVCCRWRGNFSNFYKDMGYRPRNSTLDRINNDCDYSPDNCRWATRLEQTRNMRLRKSNKSGYRGVYLRKDTGTWMFEFRVGGKRLRFANFKSLPEAIKARKEAELKYWIT